MKFRCPRRTCILLHSHVSSPLVAPIPASHPGDIVPDPSGSAPVPAFRATDILLSPLATSDPGLAVHCTRSETACLPSSKPIQTPKNTKSGPAPVP